MNRNDPALINNPYALYRQWRDEQPIWWSDGETRGWLISRHGDVRRVLKDPQDIFLRDNGGKRRHDYRC